MFDWIYDIYNSFTNFIKTYVFGFAQFVDNWFGGIIAAILAFAYWGVPWILRRIFPAAVVLGAVEFIQKGAATYLLAWAWGTATKLIGVTTVGYIGWNVLIPRVQSFMISAFQSVPKEMLPIIQYMGVDDAIHFLFSVFFWVATINAAKYVFKPPLSS